MRTAKFLFCWILTLLWLVPACLFGQASDAYHEIASHYEQYPYIYVLKEGESVGLTDEAFYERAGRIVFPVNKYIKPKNDALLGQLEREVIPIIRRDSLQLVCMIIRGAASPEGPMRWNDFLGHARARTLIRFLGDQMGTPLDEREFDLQIDIEDYRTLCIVMHKAGDKDYEAVKTLCDKYLPGNQLVPLKAALQRVDGGRLWQRLLREYYPDLRAARVVFFFRARMKRPQTPAPAYVPYVPEVRLLQWQMRTVEQPVALRELLSVKSNLLLDFAYMPGYNRWCPIPNIALEYYPLHGHFTFGASLDFPWWQHYNDHKFFQIRNWQLEARYYLRSGDIRLRQPGKGAAFQGWYLQGYVHTGVFGICFDANRGWVGEGGGAGVGVGYVLPLNKSGHWRMELGLQAGFFRCQYDPYQFENLINPDYHDRLYYYKWRGLASDFKKRQYRWSWIGPTRVGVTISYDLLYRRRIQKGVTLKNYEIQQVKELVSTNNEQTEQQ